MPKELFLTLFCMEGRQRRVDDGNPSPLKRPTASSRWYQEPLSRFILIERNNVTVDTIQKGLWSCSAKDGIAFVEWNDGLTNKKIIHGNQGRLLRLFQEEQNDFQHWNQWESQIQSLEARGVALSFQLVFQLQQIFHLQAIVGLHPMLVPDGFISVLRDGVIQSMNDVPTLYVVSNRDKQQWETLFTDENSNNKIQFIMAMSPDSIQSLWLAKKAVKLRQFQRGSLILQQRNSWKKAHRKTRATQSSWELWCRKGVPISDAQSNMLNNIKLSHDGRLSGKVLLKEDLVYGPAACMYDPTTLVIATDGSLQVDGTMGAAATTLSDDYKEEMTGVGGSPSSTLAEMVALQLATDIVKVAPNDSDVVILTDSLTSLSILDSSQRSDFQVMRPYEEDVSIVATALIRTLNECIRPNRVIRIQKIKAHALEPLNERADELAEQAARLPPIELPGETNRCRLVLPGADPRSWSSALSKAIVQIIAQVSLRTSMETDTQSVTVQRHKDCLIVKPVTKTIPKTNKWLLWRNASRKKLGQILREKKYDRNLKVITQAMSNSYPTQVNLHIWKKAETPVCPLGCQSHETFAHLQCYCERLKSQRISVHHKIWTTTTTSILKCLPHNKVTFVAEATIPRILDAIETSMQPSGDKEALQLSIANINWEVDPVSSSEQSIAQGVDAMANIEGCAVLSHNPKRPHPSAEGGSAKKGRTQLREKVCTLKRSMSDAQQPGVSAKCSRQKTSENVLPIGNSKNKNTYENGLGAGASSRCTTKSTSKSKHKFFPHLTKPTSEGYLSIMHRSASIDPISTGSGEGGDQAGADARTRRPLPIPDIGRQRPDGVLIDWRRRRFHILEFTRPYDSRRESLARTNLYKLLKYEPLYRRIRTALPKPWTASVAAFAVGVRGTADKPSWSSALRHLGITSRRHHDQIIKATIRSSLDAIYEMTDARLAALRNGSRETAGNVASPTVTRSCK